MPNPDKTSYIAAFFTVFEKKVDRLSILRDSFPEEAFTLCLVYIDRLASGRYGGKDPRNRENFWRALTELTSISVFGLLHPDCLIEEAERHTPSAVPTLRALVANDPTALLTEQQVSDAIRGSDVEMEDRKKVLENLWRASVANITYDCIRNPAIHGPGAGGLSFSETTHNGKKGLVLDFDIFYDGLRQVSSGVKALSVATGEWFGNSAFSVRR